MNQTPAQSNISLQYVYPQLARSWLMRPVLKLVDKVMGLSALKSHYVNHDLPGKSSQQFTDSLIKSMDLRLEGVDGLKQQLPKQGATIIVANHPFGCIEGIALAQAAKSIRSDVKVLANNALGMFAEIRDFFIFIDPLKSNNPKNGSAIRACRKHLNAGGCLIIFPAGKVAEYNKRQRCVTDTEWNRLPAQLAKATNADVLPIFFEGTNSKLFIFAGRIWSKLKLLMLFRELLNKSGQTIQMRVGNLIPNSRLAKLKDVKLVNDYLRLQVFLLNVQTRSLSKSTANSIDCKPLKAIAEAADKAKIDKEVSSLPQEQHLFAYKQFDVFYGKQEQMPTVVFEIARLRELVFREHDEGSGERIDTDEFDQTYVHLFIFDRETKSIIGAYRMGLTDELIAQSGLEGLYLSKMFEFEKGFANCQEPCIEMGRSFLVPEHQKSFYGLYLLWRGIGEFVVRFPKYRKLYGTVSISKLYQGRSVDVINRTLLTPNDAVKPYVSFTLPADNELNEFLSQHQSTSTVISAVVQGIEPDNKDLPILLKHYQKMNAQFYCIGIDRNFNDTPGLLLCVDLPAAPQRMLKQYLAEGMDEYLKYMSEKGQ